MRTFFRSAILVTLFVAVFSLATIFSVKAQGGPGGLTGGIGLMQTCNPVQYNIHGQLWSSTIGWIYLNCAEFPSAPNFGVSEDSSGAWTGYAWSNNVGWIQFGGITPPGGLVSAKIDSILYTAPDMQVRRVLQTDTEGGGAPKHRIVGWAKVLAGDDLSSDGWDGLISMNMMNDHDSNLVGRQKSSNLVPPSTYGVSATEATPNNQRLLSGYAWGSSVVGWIGFCPLNPADCYVDVSNLDDALITLSASPSQVVQGGGTVLTYSIIDIANADQFDDTESCTASLVGSTSTAINWTTPTNDKPSLSATHTSRQIVGVSVPDQTTTYKISCPRFHPDTHASLAPAEAITTVTYSTPTDAVITLTSGPNDICALGSANSTQTSLISWTSSNWGQGQNVQNCKLYDGNTVVYTGMGTSGNYTLPASSSTGAHNYTVKCFDTGGNLLHGITSGAQIVSNQQTVTIYPTTNSTPPIDCTQPVGGVTLGGGGVSCPADPATITWNTWGQIPPQYTFAKLMYTMANIAPNPITANAVNGTHTGLTDSADVVGAGFYWIALSSTGGTYSQVYGPISVTANQGATCHTLTLPNGGPYCPTGSINTSAPVLPATYTWSTSPNANSCSIPGGSGSGPTGSITLGTGDIPIGQSITRTLSCNWTTGGNFSSTVTATYGPRLSATNQFCTTPPGTSTRPKVIEE